MKKFKMKWKVCIEVTIILQKLVPAYKKINFILLRDGFYIFPYFPNHPKREQE